MTSLSIIDNIDIAAPCPANWNDMHGGDQVRFCGSCEKNVYNLSAITRQQALALVQELEGDGFCGRFYRRADGTMLTVDCPMGLKEKARRASRRAFAASLYLVTLLTCGALSFFFGRVLATDVASTANNISSHAADRVFGPAVVELVEVAPSPDEVQGEIEPVREVVLKGDVVTASPRMGGIGKAINRR